MSPQKRRSHSRVPVGVSVVVRTPAGQRTTTEEISNISLGGVFISMTDPLPFGAEVELEFRLPLQNRSIASRGLVVWSSQGRRDVGEERRGIGVKLMDISAADTRLLAEYIERTLHL